MNEITYDYVVVGGGSAGCVLASRLSEDPRVSVLLLEAGGEDDLPDLAQPPAWPTLWGTEVDHGYATVAQAGTEDRVHAWPRGKVLGGSSSINAMVYLRGHPADFDGWADQGCTGWDYDSLLPYFMRMESVPEAGPVRGTDGPLRPAPSAQPNPLSGVFVTAAQESGFPVTKDFNGEQAEGTGWHDLTITDEERQSTSAAYLRQIRDGRTNLDVRTSSPARRLLISNGRCTGVEYECDGEVHKVTARREVVLSAGAVDSPRLLLLSGIGPRDILQAAGVDVVLDLPGVGRNLHDHPLCGVVYEASQSIPLGATNHAETSLVWRSDDALPGPDMQIMFIHVPFHGPHLTAPANSFTFGVACIPESRGSVTINSADPADPPVIDPGYLSDPRDVDRIVEGIGVARKIAAAAAFDGWRGREVLPGPEVVDDEDLRSYAARATGTYFHPVGTCAMGITAVAVVDPDLRVRGIEGLRVADASIMPTVVCVNTNAAAIMIGEKAAELIKAAR